jgi:hypothetical protein
MTRAGPTPLARCQAGVVTAGATILGLALLVAPSAGRAASKTLENGAYHFVVAVPEGCRHEEGPGTVDAICSADLDPEASATASRARALVLQVSAEIVADDVGKTAHELAERFGAAAFQEELPAAVCDETEKGRARIANVKMATEENRIEYTADVVCAAVRFLQLGERRASVRYVIGAGGRYRLVARAPAEDFAGRKEVIAAFLASFRMLPAGR